MPANVAAILKKAEAGAELACRAHETEFVVHGERVKRGVLSHYADKTLAQAQDMAAWLRHIEQVSMNDIANGNLAPHYGLSLQLAGDHTAPLA